jgi:hypothetical protein
MDDFKTLPTYVLLDLLSEHTAEFLRMVREGAPTVKYLDTQRMVSVLQDEINFRQSSVSNTDFGFTTNISE